MAKINKQLYNGFRLLLEENLSEEQNKIAIEFMNNFIQRVKKNNGSWNFWSRGGHKSFLARNNFGCVVDCNNKNPILTFRRISNHKREFAIHKIEHLLYKDKNDININHCRCYNCLGGEKVIWKDNNKPKFRVIYEYGII